jgi:hypothetical protein
MATVSRSMCLIAAALGAGLAVPAHADNGIRLGGSDGRLHPFLELDGRYDSNVAYSEQGKQIADIVRHVRPGLQLTIPGELTSVEFSGALDWVQYSGIEKRTTDLSRLYADAQLKLTANRGGAIGLELTDAFRRNNTTTGLSLGSAAIANWNDLTLAVPMRPGSGALLVTAGGEWILETFDPYLKGVYCDPAVFAACDPSVLSKLGYNELHANGEISWSFLPRTAAVLGLTFFDRIPSDRAYSIDFSGIKADAGITGLVTPHISTTLRGGYADTFKPAGATFGTWLATVEGEWLPTETAGVRIGYRHDLGTDPGRTLSAYTSHRLYADARILLAGRFTLRAFGQWDRQEYRSTSGADAQLFRAEPSAEAEVTRWLRLALGYTFTKRESTLPGLPDLPGFNYTKNETFLRATARY